jgi:hypothetical protein
MTPVADMARKIGTPKPSERAKEVKAPKTVRRSSEPADFEKETIITFNEAEPMATIFTYNRAWQQGLRALGLKPTMDNGHGGLEFQVAKSRISPPRGRASARSVKKPDDKERPRRRQLELFPPEPGPRRRQGRAT